MRISSRHPERRQCRGRATARGFVLIEALVGLMIFTIGVLGLIGVQTAMVRAQTSANFRAEAAQLASDVVGRMWVDTANVADYLDPDACQANTLCNEWLERVASRLPGGVAPVIAQASASDPISITISWVVPGETDNGGLHAFRTVTSVTPQPTK
jgi:type IV pilus assembly protein PilV